MATVYDVWAQKVLGGTKTLVKAIDEFGNCENIYNVCKNRNDLPSCFNKISKEKLFSYTIDEASEIFNVCDKHSWKIISFSEDVYPPELLSIPDYPAVLFCDGDVSLFSSKYKVAVVGTRNPSDKGRSVAYKTGLSLSSAGVCLVSGGAFGIDNCAHEGAVLGGSGTISVLGCGLGSDYVNKIPFSADRIRKHGLMITEMFPFEKPGRYTFPKRNRILSGLSQSCVVIECSEKSGALITAELAIKQNRKVFYISPDILNFSGQNNLSVINAEPVETMYDIFSDYEGLNLPRLCSDLHSDGLEGRNFLLEGSLSKNEYSAYHHTENTNRNTNKLYKPKSHKKINSEQIIQSEIPGKQIFSDNSSITDNDKLVLSCLSDKSVFPDEIVDRTGLDIVTVTISLTNLEIDGLIKMNPGNTVTLK